MDGGTFIDVIGVREYNVHLLFTMKTIRVITNKITIERILITNHDNNYK